MKKFILTLMAVFAFNSEAWYPHKNQSEIRFIASHSGPMNLMAVSEIHNWDISGQLLQKKLSDKSQMGAMFELGHGVKESKIGAHYTYSVNQLLDVGIAGDVSNLKNMGASFWINLNLPYKSFLFKPFINVDHRTLAETGLISYFTIQGVECNLGLAYAPAVGKRNVPELSLLFGTSFSVNALFDKFLGKKKS